MRQCGLIPKRARPNVLAVATVLLVAHLVLTPARAQWLQWGGPRGDFTCDSSGLAEQWPAGGPHRLWTNEIGPGHSAIVTDGDVLYTLCRRGDQDAVLAFDAGTGKKLWETQYAAPTRPDMLLDFGAGPHSTPLLVGDRVYTVGSLVHFHCLDKKTGQVLWMHDLMSEMGASHVQRGYGASPLAYNGLVILNVGGTDAGVAAFKQDTGDLVWKSEKFPPGYSSPILARINNEDHLIVALGAERAGLDPATGKTRWHVTVDRQSYSIMSTPVFIPPDRVFFTAGYGGGTRMFRIGVQDGAYAAEELWYYRKMGVMHGNVIRIGDTIYGSSGDFDPAFMMAIDIDTGKVAWRKRGFAKATLLLADGKLILLDELGTLALVKATPEGLEVLSQAKVLEEKSWTVPTLVGTRLYLRDEHTIMALDLSKAGNEPGGKREVGP